MQEGCPADFAEEFGGEAGGEDGEFGLVFPLELVVVADDIGGLGSAPDGHGFGGGDVCEDGTEVFGEATEAAEAEFEPG